MLLMLCAFDVKAARDAHNVAILATPLYELFHFEAGRLLDC